MIPNYKGYVKYNYADDTVYLQNEDYVDKDIENKIKDRTDLYYIV